MTLIETIKLKTQKLKHSDKYKKSHSKNTEKESLSPASSLKSLRSSASSLYSTSTNSKSRRISLSSKSSFSSILGSVKRKKLLKNTTDYPQTDFLNSIPLEKNTETIKTILSSETTDTLIDKSDYNLKTPVLLDIPTFTVQSPIVETMSTNSNNLQEGITIDPIPKEVPIPSLPEEIPTSKITKPESKPNPESKPKDIKKFSNLIQKIKNFFLSFYSCTLKNGSNSLLSLYNSTLSTISLSISKFIDFSKYYYLKSLSKIKENPLLTYDALYLFTCGALVSGIQLYNKQLLMAKINSNNTLPIAAASFGICFSIMGVGNYIYLKKLQKPKK